MIPNKFYAARCDAVYKYLVSIPENKQPNDIAAELSETTSLTYDEAARLIIVCQQYDLSIGSVLRAIPIDSYNADYVRIVLEEIKKLVRIGSHSCSGKNECSEYCSFLVPSYGGCTAYRLRPRLKPSGYG